MSRDSQQNCPFHLIDCPAFTSPRIMGRKLPISGPAICGKRLSQRAAPGPVSPVACRARAAASPKGDNLLEAGAALFGPVEPGPPAAVCAAPAPLRTAGARHMCDGSSANAATRAHCSISRRGPAPVSDRRSAPRRPPTPRRRVRAAAGLRVGGAAWPTGRTVRRAMSLICVHCGTEVIRLAMTPECRDASPSDSPIRGVTAAVTGRRH